MTKFISFTMFAMMAAATTAGCADPGAGTDEEVATDEAALESNRGGRSVSLSGPWVNSAPCTFTQGDPGTPGPFKCDGYTTFTGAMTGSSHYYATGTIKANGDYVFTMTETFNVRLKNGASGSFNMYEKASIEAATGNLQITGNITGGTGSFRGACGNISFPGVSDANGVGTGTYSGKINY